MQERDSLAEVTTYPKFDEFTLSSNLTDNDYTLSHADRVVRSIGAGALLTSLKNRKVDEFKLFRDGTVRVYRLHQEVKLVKGRRVIQSGHISGFVLEGQPGEVFRKGTQAISIFVGFASLGKDPNIESEKVGISMVDGRLYNEENGLPTVNARKVIDQWESILLNPRSVEVKENASTDWARRTFYAVEQNLDQLLSYFYIPQE